MKFTDEDFSLLQAIYKSALLNFPSPSDVVEAAKPFIESGMVVVTGEIAKNGAADLSVTNEGKWKLLADGRKLQD